MADQSGGSGGGGGSNAMMRDYRKGNWNVNETMILIEAKKMDDERRTKRSEESGEGVMGGAGRGGAKPSEPRWKWVEDYCWRRACFRSQNQCNDKWDNLMRDYKKVREYERQKTGEEEEAAAASYWKMEKSERKERNLPTNMMPQIYEALVDVVERKAGGVGAEAAQRAAAAASSSVATYSIDHPNPYVIQPPLSPQQHVFPGPVVPALLPGPSQTPEAPPQLPSAAASQPLPTPESEPSDHSDSPAKRRRRRAGDRGAAGSEDRHEPDVGTAISRSASIIAEALQACDEREERRHRDLVGLHERRLKLEESKTEINRQGMDGLVGAINKLATSIHALASSSKNQSSS